MKVNLYYKESKSKKNITYTFFFICEGGGGWLREGGGGLSK